MTCIVGYGNGKRVIIAALRIAERNSAGVRGPFWFVEVERE